MRYVGITMEGHSIGSRHFWVGIVSGGLVKLKPGFKADIFCDEKTENYYNCDPMSAAACRNLADISETQYQAFGSTEKTVDCGCRKSDAWRCAIDQNAATVACPCKCHKTR